MDTTIHWLLIPSVFAVALLYASVGHGGGSGYLAVLSLVAWQPDAMATTALLLNLCVAGIGCVAFARAGHFSGRLTWPLVIASVPAAVLGGLMHVSVRSYALLLAAALLVAALRLACPSPRQDAGQTRQPQPMIALPVGAAIGWWSGVVGIGGGIVLSPLLVLSRWATPHQASAACACFILLNSAAGLCGRWVRQGVVYGTLWPLVAAAFAGGLVGSRLGARHCSGTALKRLLAVVLVVASLKLLRMAL